ncbi:hypothetical protein JXO59_09130 [candidate division KSB1 bacterium]|nr:hypothetical protein [candidate division KSB1 bacterium]
MLKKVSLLKMLLCICILTAYGSAVFADDSEFRLVISRNDNRNTNDGRLHVDVEMRIAPGSTSPRTLNSLTVDVTYGTELTAFATNPDSNWFAGTTGYDLSVNKLTSPVNYYRVLVTGNGIGKNGPGDPSGFTVTSSWQRVVTLRWNIATVSPSYTVDFVTTTDCAAYFDNLNNNPQTDLTEWATSTCSPANLLVAAKIFLHGPYNTTSHNMTTALRTPTDYVPLTSPYDWDKRTVGSIPSTITDWVCVQLRSSASGKVLSAKSIFLRNDGYIVADDGTTQQFTMASLEGEKDYYIVIRHRNHLAVMSNSTPLSAGSVSTYDFTDALSKYYGSDARLLETGVYGMYAGDADGNGTVDANDRSATWNDRNAVGYQNSDCGLDGTVDANDRSITWNLRNKFSNVPTN